jgi:hypothetical protein
LPKRSHTSKELSAIQANIYPIGNYRDKWFGY